MDTELSRTLYLVATLPQERPYFSAPLAPEASSIASLIREAHLKDIEFSCRLGTTPAAKETARLLRPEIKEIQQAIGFGTHGLPDNLPEMINLSGSSHQDAYNSAPEDTRKSMRSCGIAVWGAIRGFPGVHLEFGESALICIHPLLIELAFTAFSGGTWPDWLSVIPGDIHRIMICMEGSIRHDQFPLSRLSIS